eukprot:SAG11_NODE_8751_length_980_cov_1.085131_2_plen_147_part_00
MYMARLFAGSLSRRVCKPIVAESVPDHLSEAELRQLPQQELSKLAKVHAVEKDIGGTDSVALIGRIQRAQEVQHAWLTARLVLNKMTVEKLKHELRLNDAMLVRMHAHTLLFIMLLCFCSSVYGAPADASLFLIAHPPALAEWEQG